MAIHRGKGKLGITLVGPVDAADTRVGIFVTKVAPESPAKGIIRAKSRVYMVDGHDVTGTTKSECVKCINAAGETVSFVVSTVPDAHGYSQFKASRPVSHK